MDNGILALIGGLASGVVQGSQAQQKRKVEEEYKKALIDQAKMQAKYKEQEINLNYLKMQREQESDQWLRQMLGGGGPGAQGQAIPQGAGPGGMPMPAPQGMLPPEIMPQGNLPIQPQGGGYGAVQQQLGGGVIPQARAEGMAIPNMSGNLVFTGTTGRSATNNNPLNLEYRPGSYQDQYGATIEPVSRSGSQRFAKFPDMISGYKAGLDQIKIDQGRGHTLASFVTKFAPPHENPTNEIITSYAQQLGVSPNTPLSDIPAEKLIIPMMARESSTRMSSAPVVQTQSQIAPVQQAQGQGQGKTPIDWNNPFVRMLIKDRFKIDPMRVQQVRVGADGNFYVFDNSGNLANVVQGPRKVQPYSMQSPDGTEYQVFQPTPREGEPMPQAVGIMPTKPNAQAQGIQGGITQKYKDEIAGFSPEVAGKINLMNNAIKRAGEATTIVLGNGQAPKVNRNILFKGALPGAGVGEARTLYSKMYQAIDGALRLETGAQATEDEIRTKMNEYYPNWKDTDETIVQKMEDFNEYLNGLPGLMKGGGRVSQPQKQQKQQPKQKTVIKTGTYNGKKVIKYSDGTVEYAD